MVHDLMFVLLNSPGGPIPHPWERCFDITNGVLFYSNSLDDTILIDLRCQINLGSGLFHTNDMWQELSGCTCCFRHRRPSVLHNQNPQPFLLHATCCGPLVYLLMPEFDHCPFCGSFVYIVG